MVASRDELRSRPRALPPREVKLSSGGHAVFPVDPISVDDMPGTWIAASDAGLVLTLLNGNPSPPVDLPPKDALQSRGTLIPNLIDQPDAHSAIKALISVAFDCFAPFRLIAVDSSIIIDAIWDRSELTVSHHRLKPICFASSGLGDELVQVRLPLFAQLCNNRQMSPEAQDEFHAHRWPDRPHLSVMMERDDARTVSVTSVDVDQSGVTLRYTDLFDAVPIVTEHHLPAPARLTSVRSA